MSENWVPEIMYEDTGEEGLGLTSHIPFIPVPEDEEMPKLVYIFESRETGEIEPGPEGEELPVTEMELHQYADMNVLKTSLDLVTYDKVREALGLQSMLEAVSEGKNITNNIRRKLGQPYENKDGIVMKDEVVSVKTVSVKPPQ